jgi:hypothetical protein
MWQQLLFDTLGVLGIFSFVSLGWLLFKLPRFEEAVDFAVTLVRKDKIKPAWSQIIPTLVFSIPVVIYHIPHFPTWQNLMKQDSNKNGEKVGSIYQDLALGIMLAIYSSTAAARNNLFISNSRRCSMFVKFQLRSILRPLLIFMFLMSFYQVLVSGGVLPASDGVSVSQNNIVKAHASVSADAQRGLPSG